MLSPLHSEGDKGCALTNTNTYEAYFIKLKLPVSTFILYSCHLNLEIVLTFTWARSIL